MKMRTAAKSFALAYIERRADEEGGQFNYNDEPAVDAIVRDLEHALGEDAVRDQILRELAEVGLRDADRVLSQHRAGERVRLAQTELFMDYDKDEILVLGDSLRVKLRFARYEHFDLNNAVEVDNKIAQDRAFARKMERNRAAQEALRPLDPRTTLGEIVHSAE